MLSVKQQSGQPQKPMRLAEVAVVLALFGLLWIALLPDVLNSSPGSFVVMDGANLRHQGMWLEDYRRRHGRLPRQGGHKLLLSLWVEGCIARSADNLDRFFTPGRREKDERWLELRGKLRNGDPVWNDIEETSSADTSYAARATEHLKSAATMGAALAATDNENDRWVFEQGCINVLYAGVRVRSYWLQDLVDSYGWPGLQKVFPTYGPASPDAELRKLAR